MQSSFLPNTELSERATWQQQADRYLIQKDYAEAVLIYEQAIEAEPDNKSYYWHLGLMLLLQGLEAEAQTTWFVGMADEDEDQVVLRTEELLSVLEAEAERQRLELEDYAVAWTIRQHIREVNPADVNNILHLIGLSTALGRYTGEELTELRVIDILKSESESSIYCELLMQVLKNILDCAPAHPSTLKFTEACQPTECEQRQ